MFTRGSIAAGGHLSFSFDKAVFSRTVASISRPAPLARGTRECEADESGRLSRAPLFRETGYSVVGDGN